MKKYWKLATFVTVLIAVVALVSATAAFAQGPANRQMPDGNSANSNRGSGLANETGAAMNLMAVDEADMHAAIADALGMSLDEFETAVAEGKTPSILADELGIDFAEIQAAMDALHDAAFEQATTDGIIPQEQADWMMSHRGGAAGQSGGMGNGQSGAQGAGSAGHSHSNTGGGTGECTH